MPRRVRTPMLTGIRVTAACGKGRVVYHFENAYLRSTPGYVKVSYNHGKHESWFIKDSIVGTKVIDEPE